MPTALVRAVGVDFQPNGNFYTVGGRTADTAGSDFQHVLQYDPTSNSWTQMPSTLPDNQMNNMACGVLTVSGTPLIYCVGGSAAGNTTATARVFTYDPATDTPALLGSDDWPGDAAGTILPGGFTVANNKLYILGGFNINVASTNEIWEFNPNAAAGSRWTQKVNTPEGIMYAPTCSIGGIIYVGGASDWDGTTVIDTTNSFSFNPVANSIGTITAIPRATGETRGLNFNGQMYVMGGGRVAPNPSNEVDVYDPGTNSWSTAPSFNNARRNFPTDTDGTTHIYLSGGYDVDGLTPLASMEIFCQPGATPTPTPTATATPTPTATGTATATATATASPTATPPGTRTTPTPRPRPTPPPRP
jgi:N-acetylneuraminic acid mutarotase